MKPELSLRLQPFGDAVREKEVTVVSHQIRAARGFLHWSARVLAERAGVGIATVYRMERAGGPVTSNTENVRRVQDVLERAGVEFLADDDGLGVRLKAPSDPVTRVPTL